MTHSLLTETQLLFIASKANYLQLSLWLLIPGGKISFPEEETQNITALRISSYFLELGTRTRMGHRFLRNPLIVLVSSIGKSFVML
jgi:hypothetical protein